MTSVAPDWMMRVWAWYDNEWGYSQRLVEMARYIGEKIKASS
jgi:glyceraldehyde 3-phosphate dehydrogenase